MILACSYNLCLPWLSKYFNTMRERLRNTHREANVKVGDQRVELDGTLCWAQWLAWILSGLEDQNWQMS